MNDTRYKLVTSWGSTEMIPFDECGSEEVEFRWEMDFSRIYPHFFDMADMRVS